MKILNPYFINCFIAVSYTHLVNSQLKDYENIAKQMNDYYLPGIQRLILELVIEAKNALTSDAVYDGVIANMLRLYQIVKKGKQYLDKKINEEEITQDDQIMDELLGHVWNLKELKEAGFYEENQEFIQLGFCSKNEDTLQIGYWLSLIHISIPSIIAQLVNILYNIVDRIYIGQMANGTIAMAALSVTLPIVTFVSAFTQLVGVGGAPLCAIRLGEQRKDKAEEIMTNSFVLLIICGLVLTLLILFFNRPLLLLFGANEETLAPAISYISIYALGTIFVHITLGMNAYINTQGFAKIGMYTVVIGAIINIVLDPLFIFVFDMGVAGAALATIIAQEMCIRDSMYID